MTLTTFIGVITDTSTLLALFTVLIVDVYTVYRAHENAIRNKLFGTRTTTSSPTDRFVASHAHSLDGPWIWALPIIAAVTLLILFFLLPYLGAILLLFSAFTCGVAIVFVLLPFGSFLACRIPRLRGDDDNVAATIVSPIATFIVLYWLFTGSYFANDILGIALCILFGAVCRVFSFRSLVILMSGLFSYDVFFVFFSERFFSKNVMVEVATSTSNNPANSVASWFHLPFSPVKSLAIPAKLIFPSADGSYTILGLGDIVLAELLLVYLVQLDIDLELPLWNSFFAHALGAHIVALFVSFYCNAAFQAAQPALFYIVPLTLTVTVYMAWKHNILVTMWNERTTTRNYHQLENSRPEERESVVQSTKSETDVTPA